MTVREHVLGARLCVCVCVCVCVCACVCACVRVCDCACVRSVAPEARQAEQVRRVAEAFALRAAADMYHSIGMVMSGRLPPRCSRCFQTRTKRFGVDMSRPPRIRWAWAQVGLPSGHRRVAVEAGGRPAKAKRGLF